MMQSPQGNPKAATPMIFPTTALMSETASLPPALFVSTTFVLTVVGMQAQMTMPVASPELIGVLSMALATPQPMSGVIPRQMSWMSTCKGSLDAAEARTLVFSPRPAHA